MLKTHNKAMKNSPQKTWAGLANVRPLLGRYTAEGAWKK